MKFSIIIPARNEAEHIGTCLASIHDASRHYPESVEAIVVANRCTDSTEDIARKNGARVVHDDSRNLAKIRNSGARLSTGNIIVTIDADSRMSPNMLEEIDKALSTGKYIGGGVPIYPERLSPGIFLTGLLIFSLLPGLSAGLFWCYKNDFMAINGFNENIVIGEDVDFAKRLKAHGKLHGKHFGTLWRTHIITSCRKFDSFGDWFLIKKPRALWKALHGIDTGLSNKIFYDYQQ